MTTLQISPANVGNPVANRLQIRGSLIGGFNPLEKYESDWIIIPTGWKKKGHVPNHQPDMTYTIITNMNCWVHG